MAVLFSEWYNTNEQRQYPVHEQATGLSDDGTTLPDDGIADMNIWIPEAAGFYVYLSSFTVSDHIVSATFMAVDYDPLGVNSSSSSASPSTPVIVASVTLTKPVTMYRTYDLTPHYPGVSGHIAFGHGINNNTTLMFEDPGASVLVRRAARHYEGLPMIDIGKAYSTNLTGVVLLKGGNDINITTGTKIINGVSTDVILLGLDVTDGYDVYERYLSECDGRPESDTCGRTPVQSINMVSPDCDGNLDILFYGDIYDSITTNGIVLDVPHGMEDVCPDKLVREASLDECAAVPYIAIQFEIPTDPGNFNLHFGVQMATDFDFTNIVVNHDSTAGTPFPAGLNWEYWDGTDTWVPVPLAGVTSTYYGEDVKYTNTTSGLEPATRYWVRVRSQNVAGWGAWSNKFSYYLREGG